MWDVEHETWIEWNAMRELWCVNRDERRARNFFPDLPWIQNDFLAPATEFGVDPTGC